MTAPLRTEYLDRGFKVTIRSFEAGQHRGCEDTSAPYASPGLRLQIGTASALEYDFCQYGAVDSAALDRATARADAMVTGHLAAADSRRAEYP